MSFLCFTTNGVLLLAFLSLILYEVSVDVFVHIRVQAKSSIRTTVGTFSNFNVHAPTLSFRSYIIMCSWCSLHVSKLCYGKVNC